MGSGRLQPRPKDPDSPSERRSCSAKASAGWTSFCLRAKPSGAAAPLCSHCVAAGSERRQDYWGRLRSCGCSQSLPASKALPTPPTPPPIGPRTGETACSSCSITEKSHQFLWFNGHWETWVPLKFTRITALSFNQPLDDIVTSVLCLRRRCTYRRLLVRNENDHRQAKLVP